MRAFAGFVAVCAGVLGFAWFAAPVYWSEAQARAVVASGVICVGAAVASLAPVVWANARAKDWLNQAGLAAMGVRMFLTLGAGGAYLWAANPPRTFYLASVCAWYLALLASETVLIVAMTRKYWGAKASKGTEGRTSE